MTVSLSYKMQNNNSNPKPKTSSSKKQRPRHQAGPLSAMGSATSLSCVPANYAPTEEELSTEAAATTITTQANTRNESIDEDSKYSTEDLKQECMAPEPRVSVLAGGTEQLSQENPVSVGEISKVWQSYVDGALSPGTGPPNPPPSLVSATSSAQSSDQNRIPSITMLASMCVPVDKLLLSENVPMPSKTDVIARVSREELCRDVASLKDDEGSDAFASGEELDVDKRSEYSTADEGDCETQYRKKVEIKTQAAINEDEDSSPEDDESSPEDENSFGATDSARTDATTQRDPCASTYAILGADSEALRPVLVRQVSEDEEVRVTSDDDEVERNSPAPCTSDTDRDEPEKGSDTNAEEDVFPTQNLGSAKVQGTQDMSTSPISKSTGPTPEQGRCDGATEPIHWIDEEDNKSGVIIQETVECVPLECLESKTLQLAQKKTWEDTSFRARSSRWRSLPTLPIIESFDSGKAVCISPKDVQPATSSYPTTRSVGQCATSMLSLQSAVNLQQVKEFRVRQAMADALSLCEEELGPVALALAKLQEKVRRLNLPEIATQPRPVGNVLYGESTYLPPAPSLAVSSIVRTNHRVATSMAASESLCLPARPQIGWTHPGAMAHVTHNADCVCRYCGLQVGADANLSPVAQMYILLAQSHRSAHQHEDGLSRQPCDRGKSPSDHRT